MPGRSEDDLPHARSDRLIPLPGRMLIDQRGAGTGVPHTLHQFAQARPRGSRHRASRMPQVKCSPGRPAWPWVFPFDSSKVAGYRAITASRLGQVTIAMDAFGQADAARSPKQAALVAVEHARVLAIGSHLDQACDLAVAAYDVGCSYESERVQRAVRQFRASLGGQVAPRITAELDDRLHRAYTAGST